MSARYTPVAIVLHWLIALAILALLVMGFVMTSLPLGSHLQFVLYQLHKSVGITVLLLSLLRLAWRLSHKPPALPDHMPGWEQLLAHLGHFALYGLMIGMPLEGWALVSASVWNIPTVLYGVIPWPHLPFFSTLADKKSAEELLKQLHDAAAWIMVATLVGHIAAALRHHFLIKDDVMTRMLPRWRKS
jgi:cytochrome b561